MGTYFPLWLVLQKPVSGLGLRPRLSMQRARATVSALLPVVISRG